MRSDFSPGLEVGQRFFWDGLSRVLPDLDKGGFLEASIDDDLDPRTPEVRRREAYTRMARRSFELYSRQVPRASIANQMIHTFLALKYTTPTISRLVTAICVHSPDGALGLNTLRYGPNFIVVNGSDEKPFRYELPADLRGKPALDLLTGAQADLAASGMVPPLSSRVFVLAKGTK